MIPSPKLQLAALVGALMALPSRALALDDVLTPRGISMGGAGVASASGALGPLLNPAGMTLIRQYSVEAFYGFDVQSIGSTLHASVVDNVTSRVAAGIYYTFVHDNPKITYPGVTLPNQVLREGHETGLSLAMPFGDHFSFGLTSKYTTVQTAVANPAADQPGQPKSFLLDTSTGPNSTASGFTMDAGLALHLGDSFNIGLAGYNLIPLHSFDAPIGMGIGLSYLYSNRFIVTADARIAFDKYKVRDPPITGDLKNKISARVGVGLEYLVAGAVPVRIGFAQDTGASATYLSTGLGYMAKTFGVDIAYRQQVSHGIDSTLMVGLRLFLE